MLLSELFENDSDRGVPDDFPWMLIEMPVEHLQEAKLLLNEGQWQPSQVQGIWYRVDAERPEMKQQRHVHVAAKKHIKTPTKQASWNTDLSRHDRKSFNAALGKQQSYQAVAKAALGLSSDALLENITDTTLGERILLTEAVDHAVPVERYRFEAAPSRRSILSEIIGRHISSGSSNNKK